jgi:hypothetical protein
MRTAPPYVSRETPPPPLYIFEECGNIPRTFKQESEVNIDVHKKAISEKLKALVLSLMAIQAELRGQERAELASAIANVRKALELLK